MGAMRKILRIVLFTGNRFLRGGGRRGASAGTGRRHPLREAPALVLGCGLRRPEAASPAMGRVERRDGRRCVVEGARAAIARGQTSGLLPDAP
jgi:hypothetical protein